MKVLLTNGSPHKNGTTQAALEEMAKELERLGIETRIFHTGNKPIAGCSGCGACGKLGKCAINDVVNEFIDIAQNFDGFVFATPVHYAHASGAITSFMDRAFFSCFRSGRGEMFKLKPACAIAVARRAGTTAALDQLNKYFTISQMPVVSGRYWNMVHGASFDEAQKDLEGMQNMRYLARNMAWLLNSIEAGRKAGLSMPEDEEVTFTNFVR